MPIISQGLGVPPFKEPADNLTMARYMTLAKFISILKDKNLFLCRLDKLEDRYEGTLSKPSYQRIMEEYRYIRDELKFFERPISDSEFEHKARERVKFSEQMKPLFCVNCWSKYESESYALWKIYGASEQGIMIKTSYYKLKQAFEKESRQIYCAEVIYKDYMTEIVESGNMFSAVYTKDKAYSYESEVRLIHQVDPIQGCEHDWTQEEFENGVMAEVNLELLLEEVVISPFAPFGFRETVQDVMKRYDMKCNIRASHIALNR